MMRGETHKGDIRNLSIDLEESHPHHYLRRRLSCLNRKRSAFRISRSVRTVPICAMLSATAPVTQPECTCGRCQQKGEVKHSKPDQASKSPKTPPKTPKSPSPPPP